MHQAMHYNFNIYRRRKMFNLNFTARTDKQAIAEATDLVPNFAEPSMDTLVLPTEGSQVPKGDRESP
jgi:hypothetical protein